MGKLIDRLNQQLEQPEYKKDAEDCIKIYNWIRETDPEGRVWESNWNPMVKVSWIGEYPNCLRIYRLSFIGQTLLKGIEYGKNT